MKVVYDVDSVNISVNIVSICVNICQYLQGKKGNLEREMLTNVDKC
jgi:hypothetical protein